MKNSPIPFPAKLMPILFFRDGRFYMGQRGANMAVLGPQMESHQQAMGGPVPGNGFQSRSRIYHVLGTAVATGYLPVQEKALESVSDLLSHVRKAGTVSRQWSRAWDLTYSPENSQCYVGKPLGVF